MRKSRKPWLNTFPKTPTIAPTINAASDATNKEFPQKKTVTNVDNVAIVMPKTNRIERPFRDVSSRSGIAYS
jgi:hypothetical protein